MGEPPVLPLPQGRLRVFRPCVERRGQTYRTGRADEKRDKRE